MQTASRHIWHTGVLVLKEGRGPQQPLSDILPLMASREVNQLSGVQHGTLLGVVCRDAIVHSLQVRRSLGVERAKSDTHNELSRAAQRAIGEEGSIMCHVP